MTPLLTPVVVGTSAAARSPLSTGQPGDELLSSPVDGSTVAAAAAGAAAAAAAAAAATTLAMGLAQEETLRAGSGHASGMWRRALLQLHLRRSLGCGVLHSGRIRRGGAPCHALRHQLV